ncbi:PqqD family peptide modification chaperone [Mucilaginibacter sp. AW1-3]
MPTSKNFSLNTLIQRDDSRFISNIIDGEMILMNIKTGDYVALREVAYAIWDTLIKPITVGALIALMLQEYEVSEVEGTADICNFLKELLSQGMIKIITN